MFHIHKKTDPPNRGGVGRKCGAGSNIVIPDGSIIHLEQVVKQYYIGTENQLEVLHGITLDVNRNEFLTIVGESGSGKSTLMNIIGLLDRPTTGQYYMKGQDVSELPDDELAAIRNRRIGFVFQSYNLIARTSALENVEMPLLYAGMPPARRRERAEQLLEMVGMQDRMQHDPSELSGGQKQRVAIARAMANNPDIILADEPTGALDTRTSRTVIDIFHKLHEEEQKTVLMITHSRELSAEAERILTLIDGQIVREERGTVYVPGSASARLAAEEAAAERERRMRLSGGHADEAPVEFLDDDDADDPHRAESPDEEDASNAQEETGRGNAGVRGDRSGSADQAEEIEFTQLHLSAEEAEDVT